MTKPKPKTTATRKPTTAAAVKIAGEAEKYRGVRMRKWGRWVAEIRAPNSRQRIWLGSYKTATEAARAYDAALFMLRGPHASLNFPDALPQIPSSNDDDTRLALTAAEIQNAASKHARAPPTTPGSAV
ncbi:hypothetical protein V2J09_012406 [Rumex salicifolius]